MTQIASKSDKFSADSDSYRHDGMLSGAHRPLVSRFLSFNCTGVFLVMILSLLFVLLHSSASGEFLFEKALTQRDGYKT